MQADLQNLATTKCKLTCALLVFGALAVSAQAQAHGTSKSFGVWRFEGDAAHLVVNFAAHDVLADTPALDADGDHQLSAAELEAGGPRFGEAVAQGTRLSGDASCGLREAPRVRGVGSPIEELQVELAYRCGAPLTRAVVEVHYLPALEPPHVAVMVFKAGAQEFNHVHGPNAPSYEVKLPPPDREGQWRSAARAAWGVAGRPVWMLLGLSLGLLGGLRWAALFLALGLGFGALFGGVGPAWAAPLGLAALVTTWERADRRVRLAGWLSLLLVAQLSAGVAGVGPTSNRVLTVVVLFAVAAAAALLGWGMGRRLPPERTTLVRWSFGLAGVALAVFAVLA